MSLSLEDFAGKVRCIYTRGNKVKGISLKKISLVLLSGFVFLIAGSISAVPKGKVIVYTATGVDICGPIFEAFTEDTEITVEHIIAGTGELWSRVRAEKKRPLGDVLWAGSNKMAEAAKPENLFISYHSPEDQHYLVRDPDGIWHAFGIPGGVQSFAVNTNLVAPEDYPESYRDLADVKYSGMIALLNPTYSGTGYITAQAMIHLAQTQWGYEDGWDFLKEMMMNCRIYVSSGAARNALRDGEIAIGLLGEASAAKILKDGYPIKLLRLKEGAFGGLDAIEIIKGGPNTEDAKVFVDWFLGQKAQQMLADLKGDRCIREGVTLSEDLYTYGFGDDYIYVDIPDYLFEEPDQFKKKWNEVMGQAVVLKEARDTAYDIIEYVGRLIKRAESKGMTVGIEEAESKLAQAESAFKDGKYEKARVLAKEALKLGGALKKP